MTSTTPSSSTLQWIFRGNLVVPTRNPFDNNRTPTEEEEEVNSDDCQWLGPGLQLLLDWILTVDANGTIQHLQAASSPTARVWLAQLLENLPPDCVYISLGPHEFLCPGFVDLHIHAPQYTFAGTGTDCSLFDWLETYSYPAETRLQDLELAENVYRKVVQRTLSTGTTTAVYFATLHLAPCQVLVDVAVDYGQRALVGKVSMDRHSPDNYCQSLATNLRETEALIDYVHQKVGKAELSTSTNARLPLVLPLVTPRFLPTCSHALLQGLGALVQKHNCHVTTHISQSEGQVAWSRRLDGDQGRTDAAVLNAHHLLTDKCILAHGLCLTTKDWDLLKDHGSALAHCPMSNFFFGGTALRTRRLLERGNLVGLATDVAGGYPPSMLQACRTAVLASMSRSHQDCPVKDGDEANVVTDTKKAEQGEASAALDYRHAFYLATLGGAHALKLAHKIGSLAVGLEFDAMIWSAKVPNSPLDVFATDSTADVFQKICLLGDDRNVTRVFVQGRDVTVGTKKDVGQ